MYLDSKPRQLCCQLPYCLLRARRDFLVEANRDPADYGENRGRGKLSLYFFCLSSHLLRCSHRMRGPREEDCP